MDKNEYYRDSINISSSPKSIDLTKILKNCPKGFKLYSLVHGEVTFFAIEDGIYPICVLTNNNGTAYYTSSGKLYALCGKCVLFPSEEQQDWSKFIAPWLKKERFDSKMLNAFDRVIVKPDNGDWCCSILSHREDNNIYYRMIDGYGYSHIIPYNDDTKHLVGTNEEAPEYYRYWEDWI